MGNNKTRAKSALANPKIEVRREGHLVKTDTFMEGQKTKRRIQGEGLGIYDEQAGGTSADPTESASESHQGRHKGFEKAIENLTQMDRRLRSATKRQKVKVEESSIATRKDAVNDAGIHPKRSECPDDETKGVRCAQEEEKDEEDEHEDEATEALDEAPERGAAREPPVNSDYLPLPWTGRLGYACLNTYLRTAKPPVFSSRTCRMSSIIDHRHPLQDPSVPEHATKNRPDKSKPVDVDLGHRFVRGLGLANARDIAKMLRWNDKYGIKFMRLSSEMFPFASHQLHGYKLAPFAAETLAEAGKVAAALGHRLTTHPGQFTQLGSPRKDVVTAAIRDLEYHDELLSLLQLPEQQNRDAVMILHMGGVFGDKAATLDRFRANYAGLGASIKARLVLENDDVSWSVHDLLPVCEELNIPLVLDYHHHNIVFDARHVREGTADVAAPALTARIAATWRRKGITQKMHYSEPCAGAVTPRDRRKHSPRVLTLPPCPPGVDLMIEAKDKEQAVFELMRTFRLPGFERVNDMIPHERDDQGKPPLRVPRTHKKKAVGGKKRRRVGGEPGDEAQAAVEAVAEEEVLAQGVEVAAEEFGMGGPRNRVYWPLGMEVWLKPKKRETAARKGEGPVEGDKQDEEEEAGEWR